MTTKNSVNVFKDKNMPPHIQQHVESQLGHKQMAGLCATMDAGHHPEPVAQSSVAPGSGSFR